MQDSDDYFHDETEPLCVPDLPENLKTESDSIDLDDVPCCVESLPSAAAAQAATSAAPSHAKTQGGTDASEPSVATTPVSSVSRSDPFHFSCSALQTCYRNTESHCGKEHSYSNGS